MSNIDNDKSVQTLIDLARAHFRSDAALARHMGMAPQNLAQMRAGQRAISPETVGLLCEIVGCSGEESREWLALAIVTNPKNADLAHRLRRVFFPWWVLGVAALMLTTHDAQASNRAYLSAVDSLYIVRSWLASLAHRLSRWRAVDMDATAHP